MADQRDDPSDSHERAGSITCAAVVVAGGTGDRLGARQNKAFVEVGDHPMIAWTLRAMAETPVIERIVIVTRAEDIERAHDIVAQLAADMPIDVVEGGATRHASEHAGLEVLAPAIRNGELALVCIHDAARPFVSPGLIKRVVVAAAQHGGAVPCIPAPASDLLRADGDGGPLNVTEHITADDIRRVQTPQAFRALPLLEAYENARTDAFSGVDTAESIQRFSDLSIRVVDGDERNIKVTYPDDLVAARRMATQRPTPG